MKDTINNFALGLLVVLLCGCTTHNRWSVDHIKSGRPEFNSSKLSYRTLDPLHGLELELIRTQNSFNLYLHVNSQTIPPCKNNPKAALVSVITQDASHTEEAARLQGGQKILLSENLRDIIIDALQKNSSLTIRVGNYSTLIEPEGFQELLKKMESPPFYLPFRLPF